MRGLRRAAGLPAKRSTTSGQAAEDDAHAVLRLDARGSDLEQLEAQGRELGFGEVFRRNPLDAGFAVRRKPWQCGRHSGRVVP